MSYAIETQGFTKSFPINGGWRNIFARQLDRPAVDCVDLQVNEGELFGLVGPNGAGKTTLVKMLTTLILPTSGKAWINGTEISHEVEIKKSVGLVTSDERSFYWRLSGQQNLEFFAALQGLDISTAKQRSGEVLKTVGLLDQGDKAFQKYSTGMKQRLSIARALLVRPQILFLDEPTKGLDPIARQELNQLIREELTREQGMTVFLTSHNLDEVQRLCDRVAIMNQGRIRACGSLTELQNSIDTQEYYRISFRGWNTTIQTALDEQEISYQFQVENDHTISLQQGPPADLDQTNRLVDILRQQGWQIQFLARQKVSLNDLFAQITASGDTELTQDNNPLQEDRRGWLKGFGENLFPGSFAHLKRVAAAFLRCDWQSETSYRFSFLLQILNILFSVAVFYFVARLLGDSVNPYLEPYGGDYFAFVLIGIAFGSYFGVGLSGFSRWIRNAQTTGTLEAMLATPTRLSTIILSSAQWNYLLTTLRVIVYLLVGAVFLGVQLGNANYAAAFVVLILTVISFSSLGIIAASFIMVLKRGDPITWIFGAVSNLLGGIYYPIDILPDWMQRFASLIPVTYALRAMRLALLQGAGFEVLWKDILTLVIFCVLLLPIGLVSFGVAVRLARVDGSLAHY